MEQQLMDKARDKDREKGLEDFTITQRTTPNKPPPTHLPRGYRHLFLLTVLCITISVSAAASDFETSQAAISSTPYKSIACWFGVCDGAESTISLTAEPLPTDPYVPVPVAPTPAPPAKPSYEIKMTPPDATAASDAGAVEEKKYELQLKNVPGAVIINQPFSLTVVYIDTANNVLVYDDPAGNYGQAFDVTLSIGSAEVEGDSLGSWVLNDMNFGGTLTKPLHFAVAEFDDLTLNIPSTYVYLKVEAKAFGLSFTSSISLRIIDVTLTETEEIATSFATALQEGGSTSTYDKGMNRYTADASAKTALDADGSAGDDPDVHSNFDGTFIVQDYYEDSSCSKNLMWYEYAKKDSCIASPTGNSSDIISDYNSVQVTTDQYAGTLTCKEKGISNSTSVAHNKGTITENRGQCVVVSGGGYGGAAYKKIRGVKTSVKDSAVCEGAYTPVVRVSEWFGSDGSGTCHSGQGLQPTIRLYELNKCHKVFGSTASFMFTGCYHTHSGLLNEYKTADCSGLANQREWGGTEENSCFVGTTSGWGVAGGEDISVECGVTC
mmetsp:Transcript_26947/g.51062  ORF Transcript_26947/g.51062 Transcript_26947/m.51062 type:complete len:551 (+) Transcript_26947:75-1727(+)